MIGFIGRRLLISVPVLFIASILAFLFVRLAPGDPVELLLPLEARGQHTEQYLSEMRARLGLDRPLPLQYLAWMGQVLQGNLGYSYTSGRPVGSMLLDRTGTSLALVGTALTVAVVIGVPLGVAAALMRHRAMDRIVTILGMTAVAVPSFFLGLVAIKVLALDLGALPSAGTGSTTTSGQGSTTDFVRHLILPAGVIATSLVGPYMRYVRQSMIDSLGQDYMQTARVMGVRPWRKYFVWALRNALIPVVTVIFIELPVLIGSTVIVETLFAWPGLGRLLMTAITNLDYPIILGFTICIGGIVLLSNLIADVINAFLDPRIRHVRA